MSNSRKPGRPTLWVEPLEGREVPTTASLLGNILVVNGTDKADYIAVRLTGWQATVSGAAILDGNTYVSAIDAGRVHQVVVHGEAGDDTIDVRSIKVPTMIWGGTGNDRIFGGSGANIIYGDQGNDTIVGGPANDWLVGGDGNDSIVGNGGNDWITGDAGDDTLIGGSGNDSLYGGDGRDLLVGGGGIDEFNGDGFGISLIVAAGNFDTYRQTFDLLRPLPATVPTAIPKVVNLTNPGYLAGLESLSLADLKNDIRVVSRGVYDVYLPGDKRTIRVNFDGTWNDNDPMPAGGSFATLLLSRARLISFGLDPSRYYSQADFDAANARSGGRLYSPADALRQFTGRGIQSTAPGRTSFSALQSELNRGAAAVAFSYSAATTTSNANGVIGNTNYVVRRLFTDAVGRQWVELGNPLGTDRGDGALLDRAPGSVSQNDGIITLLWSDFQRASNFAVLYVA